MRTLTLIVLFFVLISCDSSRIYEDYSDLEEGFWHMDSIQSFSFEIKDPEKEYNILATFRNGSRYPFYNIYFQYTLLDSTKNTVDQQLKEFNFFDPKTGEPYGSGLGDLFDHAVPLEENYQFEYAGTYSIQLQQFMRMDTLPFIMSVGARVEMVEQER